MITSHEAKMIKDLSNQLKTGLAANRKYISDIFGVYSKEMIRYFDADAIRCPNDSYLIAVAVKLLGDDFASSFSQFIVSAMMLDNVDSLNQAEIIPLDEIYRSRPMTPMGRSSFDYDDDSNHYHVYAAIFVVKTH